MNPARVAPALAGAMALALWMTGGAVAADKLPKTLAWTAYDVGSAGYAQAVGIGAALKNQMGVTLRVLPGKNDVSRLTPLKDGKVQFSAFGIGGYQALEGADVFGHRDWGPQQLRLLSMSNSNACNTLIMAGDLGMKSYYDLKGKRLPMVKGAPALNLNTYAYLRFGNLEWSDVKVVEYGGYGQSLDGIIEGQSDGAITITTSGFATKVVSGPRGYFYAPTPHADTAAWGRMREVAPYFYKSMCSEGAGITKPFEAASYPYPILIAYASQDEGMTYAMTKAMFDLFPKYKDSAPGSTGWGMDRQVMDWVIPYHPGAVRYYKEVGKWSADLEKHQEALLHRDKVLVDAWKGYAKGAPSDDGAFNKGWMEARLAALQKAGLKPVFKSW